MASKVKFCLNLGVYMNIIEYLNGELSDLSSGVNGSQCPMILEVPEN